MKEGIHRLFGYAIAFLLPGYVLLWGLGFIYSPLAPWFHLSPQQELTVVHLAHIVLGSLAVGLVVSAVRWALIDSAHHVTGLTPPALDFSLLPERLQAFLLTVEHNYRYYQFYSNMAVSLAAVMAANLVHGAAIARGAYCAFGCLEMVLLVASRDALRRYYGRTAQMLKETQPQSLILLK